MDLVCADAWGISHSFHREVTFPWLFLTWNDEEHIRL